MLLNRTGKSEQELNKIFKIPKHISNDIYVFSKPVSTLHASIGISK